jgi:hypothetical protein
VVYGCGQRRPGEETGSGDRVWETAWVDPEMIISTDLVTLIRSARIDSFEVDPTAFAPATAPGLRFELVDTACIVAANVLDNHGRVVMPLMVQRLQGGHYKLTVSRTILMEQGLPPGNYRIGATICGDRRTREFTLP